MIFGVYHDWVHLNTGNIMDGRITEDGKSQAIWKNLSVRLPNDTTHSPEDLGEILLQPSQWRSVVYELGHGLLSR